MAPKPRKTIGRLQAELHSENPRQRDAARRELRRTLEETGFDDKLTQLFSLPERRYIGMQLVKLMDDADAFERLCARHEVDPETNAADAYHFLAVREFAVLLSRNTRKQRAAHKNRKLPPGPELLREYNDVGQDIGALIDRYSDRDPSVIRRAVNRAKKDAGA